MAGVMIHHDEMRNATLVYEIHGWPYPGGPFACSACNAFHTNKAVHIRFDGGGDSVVAEETWDLIKGHLKGHVKVKKKVSKPEPMVVGMNGGRPEIVHFVQQEDV